MDTIRRMIAPEIRLLGLTLSIIDLSCVSVICDNRGIDGISVCYTSVIGWERSKNVGGVLPRTLDVKDRAKHLLSTLLPAYWNESCFLTLTA